ncbi:MAG: tRNA glutamyl-Q(34) synthetase GluQRS [Actinomycetaceae bacterium]|nr:tRNA glutamyl-Q(34) synthetase GluQRS [Arcanobacterium sp.]MDD7504566.1 tRNA glutamyl-Q(34) synthetase GluQRS [Actinomycetaceae bacterium]MDY6143209.1 tRNA glutamyl-Q(34) synthetase GluQRS [Arcanobacterium sp.]
MITSPERDSAVSADSSDNPSTDASIDPSIYASTDPSVDVRGDASGNGAAHVGAGRYAPSPSGDLHLGNLRTALLAWAYARSAGMGFLLRFEDLDARSRPHFEAAQLRDLESLGIDWDGEPIRQSERIGIYADAMNELRRRGLLYECYCTRKELAEVASAPHRPPGSYPGTCRDLSEAEREAGRAKLAGTGRGPALRLRTQVDELTVYDVNYGTYTGAVDDLVIMRGDGVYSYNFVSVLDDALTGVTQVVRGDDLLPSAPRQVVLAHTLGFTEPQYAHVPLVLNGVGVRLAKRDGAVTLSKLADLGYTPADVVAMLAESLGYPPVRSAEEFLNVFDPQRMSRKPEARKPWRYIPQSIKVER